MNEKKYVLKIESEIGGGSLSIFNESGIFCKSEGFLAGKKSDYLIEVLKASLSENQMELGDLKAVRYSDFPGSQMGLKILASIVKGLSLAYEIDVAGRNVFDSLIDFYKKHFEDEFCIILPVNKRESMVRYANRNTSGSEKIFLTMQLPEVLSELNRIGVKTVLPLKFFVDSSETSEMSVYRNSGSLIDTGENLSIYL